MLCIKALYRIGLFPGSYSISVERIPTVNQRVILAYYHFGFKRLRWVRPDMGLGECLELTNEHVELVVVRGLVHAQMDAMGLAVVKFILNHHSHELVQK